jgi:hypothetical protein
LLQRSSRTSTPNGHCTPRVVRYGGGKGARQPAVRAPKRRLQTSRWASPGASALARVPPPRAPRSYLHRRRTMPYPQRQIKTGTLRYKRALFRVR